MNLFYDLDKKSFSSEISSNNSSIKNNSIIFDKGLFEFDNSIFDIDFSLKINEPRRLTTYFLWNDQVDTKQIVSC